MQHGTANKQDPLGSVLNEIGILPTARTRLTGYAGPAFAQLRDGVAGTGFEPV
jgi:hypothetical protein